jgi:hypothetical protein
MDMESAAVTNDAMQQRLVIQQPGDGVSSHFDFGLFHFCNDCVIVANEPCHIS